MKKPTVSLDKKVNIKRDTPWHRIRCCQLHLGSCSPTEGLTHYLQKQEHIENISCSFWLHCCSTLLLCNMKNRSGMDNTKSPTNKLTCCSFCCLLKSVLILPHFTFLPFLSFPIAHFLMDQRQISLVERNLSSGQHIWCINS